jgi:hypothetical protein
MSEEHGNRITEDFIAMLRSVGVGKDSLDAFRQGIQEFPIPDEFEPGLVFVIGGIYGLFTGLAARAHAAPST